MIHKNQLFFIAALLFLFSVQHAGSQNIIHSRPASDYTYIFKLTHEQAKQVYQDHYFWPDTSLQVIDSFPMGTEYTKVLPLGHYMKVWVEGIRLNYTPFSVGTIKVIVLKRGKDLALHVINKFTNEVIRNADVQIDDKKLKFDEKGMNYVRKNNTRDGLLCITTENEVYYARIEKNDVRYYERSFSSPPAFLFKFPFRGFTRSFYQMRFAINECGFLRFFYCFSIASIFERYQGGFLITNKPQYLPGDTVRFKAFVMNENGKGFNKSADVYLGRYYKKDKIATIKPASKGDFVYEFVLGDSLTIDRNYTIYLYSGKKELVQNDFTLKDYQLDEVSFTCRTDKTNINTGEEVTIYCEAKEANGFNIADGRLDITLTTDYVVSYKKENVFVPDVLWKTSIPMEAVGETKISVPDSIYPPVDIRVKINVSFNNSNNETHEKTLYYSYNFNNQYIKTETDQNLFEATYVENGEVKAVKGMIYAFSGEDTVYAKQILLPCTDTIRQHYEKYLVTVNNIRKFTYINEPGNFLLDFYGDATKDSVFIEIVNPFQLEYYYEICRNGKKEIKGVNNDKQWILKEKSHSKDSWDAYMHYLWGGKIYDKKYFINYAENDLNINVETPEVVYPGQRTEVKVKVADADNKPKENVNLTAGAYNAQFNYSDFPNIPSFNYSRISKRYYEKFSLSGSEFPAWSYLSGQWIDKFNLCTKDFYYFLRQSKELKMIYNPLDSCVAQFAPYVFNGRLLKPLYFIYIDNRVVYMYHTEKMPYSFYASPGYHQIRLRTENAEFIIDSVLFKNNHKLFLTFDISQLPEKVRKTEREAGLNAQEIDLMRNKTFVFTPEKYADISIWQRNRIFNLQTSYSSSLRYIGPVEWDSLHYAVKNKWVTSFWFKPNYEYDVDEKLVERNAILTKIENVANLPDGLIAFPLNHEDLVVEQLDLGKKSKKTAYNHLFEESESASKKGKGALYLDYRGDTLFQIISLASYKTDSIKFYSPERKRINNLEPGFYKLGILSVNNTTLILDSVFIKADGINYYYLKDDWKIVAKDWDKEAPDKGKKNQLAEGSASLTGMIRDSETGESLIGANVVIMKNDVVVAGASTDINGVFTIKNISPGYYKIRLAYVGYNDMMITPFLVASGKNSLVDALKMTASALDLKEFEYVAYRRPLVEADEGSAMALTVTAGEIKKAPTRSVGAEEVIQYAPDPDYFVAYDSVSYFGDGVRLKGTDNYYDPQSLKEMSGIRENFSDYAFWEPNLITNEDGEVAFKVKYPGNMTKWNAFIYAVNNKKQSGRLFFDVKTFKPQVASLSLPRFLVEGDVSNIVCKTLNYTSDSTLITTELKVDDTLLFEKKSLLISSLIETYPLSFPLKDTVDISYMMYSPNDYSDGEKRQLVILPQGVNLSTGYFLNLNKDTNMDLRFNPDYGEVDIHMEGNLIQTIQRDIDYLKHYKYDCNEQLASKLSALISEQELCKISGEKCRNEKDIRKITDKLFSNQNYNGGWGWWKSSPASAEMTAYILKTLVKLESNAVLAKSISMAQSYLISLLDKSDYSMQLRILDVLTYNDNNQAIELLKSIPDDSLSEYDLLLKYKIAQNYKLPVDISKILAMKKETAFGNYYWGANSFSFFSNDISASLLAYDILKNAGASSEILEKIIYYLLEKREVNGWRNTVESSQILNMLIPWLIPKGEQESVGKVILSGALNTRVSHFPASLKIKGGDIPLHLEKTGSSPIYFSASQEYLETKAAKKSDFFDIETHFEMDGEKVTALQSGKLVYLYVDVIAKKKADYIFIEVPIPGGCSYFESKQSESGNEIHREYFKEKTAIFAEKMDPGKYTYKIALQPRFSGKYHVNPAKVEMMYFPTISGRNDIKIIEIK